MPYIERADRSGAWISPRNVGELTFALQQSLDEYLSELGHPYRYEDLAACLGALEGAKADFVDRVLLPYERRKREENGDVWGTSVVTRLPLDESSDQA